MIYDVYMFTLFDLELESDYDSNYQEIIGSGRAVYNRRVGYALITVIKGWDRMHQNVVKFRE